MEAEYHGERLASSSRHGIAATSAYKVHLRRILNCLCDSANHSAAGSDAADARTSGAAQIGAEGFGVQAMTSGVQRCGTPCKVERP